MVGDAVSKLALDPKRDLSGIQYLVNIERKVLIIINKL